MKWIEVDLFQALTETTKKADGYSRENFVSETTLNQVRLILVDAERRRGKPYFESDPASSQSPSMLVHTLERCIQEMLKDLEIKKAKVEEVCLQKIDNKIVLIKLWWHTNASNTKLGPSFLTFSDIPAIR